jgi:hypothetical protein
MKQGRVGGGEPLPDHLTTGARWPGSLRPRNAESSFHDPTLSGSQPLTSHLPIVLLPLAQAYAGFPINDCALTEYYTMKAYWGSECTAPCILDLGTRWRWVVSFTSRTPYPQGKSPWYPLDRRLGGPQIRSGHSGGEEKNSQPFRLRTYYLTTLHPLLKLWSVGVDMLEDGESPEVCKEP